MGGGWSKFGTDGRLVFASLTVQGIIRRSNRTHPLIGYSKHKGTSGRGQPHMFTAVPLHALTDRRLGLTDLRVLGAVASFASPSQPSCWPARASIGVRCGIASESRVSKALHRLESFGWLEITRRQGSNLYRVLHGAKAPEQTCTPLCSSDVHPAVHAEQTIEQTISIPLPPGEPETETETSRPDPEALEPIAEIVEKVAKGEDAAPSAPHDPATEQPQGALDPQPQPKAVEAATGRSERIQAAMRVVERLNQTTGLQLPLDAKGTSVRRAARALNSYTEQEIQAVILAFALGFHRPASLLKSSVLEPLIAEQRRRDRDALERARRDREAIEAMRQGTGTRTREGALRGLQMLREAVGLKTKPDTDGQMRA